MSVNWKWQYLLQFCSEKPLVMTYDELITKVQKGKIDNIY